jgi:hypothetical protein
LAHTGTPPLSPPRSSTGGSDSRVTPWPLRQFMLQPLPFALPSILLPGLADPGEPFRTTAIFRWPKSADRANPNANRYVMDDSLPAS